MGVTRGRRQIRGYLVNLNIRKSSGIGRAFTMIELLLVLAILASMAMLTIPMARDHDSTSVEAAASILRSDLERAQSMAMAYPDRRIGLRIDDDGRGWSLVDAREPTTPLLDEFSGQPVKIRLGKGRGQVAPNVEVEADLNDSLLVFDSLGGLENPGPPVILQLNRAEKTASVRVSSSTGWISIVR